MQDFVFGGCTTVYQLLFFASTGSGMPTARMVIGMPTAEPR